MNTLKIQFLYVQCVEKKQKQIKDIVQLIATKKTIEILITAKARGFNIILLKKGKK